MMFRAVPSPSDEVIWNFLRPNEPEPVLPTLVIPYVLLYFVFSDGFNREGVAWTHQGRCDCGTLKVSPDHRKTAASWQLPTRFFLSSITQRFRNPYHFPKELAIWLLVFLRGPIQSKHTKCDLRGKNKFLVFPHNWSWMPMYVGYICIVDSVVCSI